MSGFVNRPAIALLAGLAVLSATPVRSDSWPAARVTEIFSASRQWFVRITPGRSLGDVVGFAGAAKGPYATAAWFRETPDRSYRFLHEVTLANPVAPVTSVVTDRGYLTTFDNWHNMGHGTVIAAYDPEGKPVAAVRLADLFDEREIQGFRTSTSSTWWRSETIFVREGQQSVYVRIDDKGAELVLGVETGQWQYCEPRAARHECRSSNAGRTWGPFREPALR